MTRSVAAPALVAVLIGATFITVRMRVHHDDVGHFVFAGTHFCDPSRAPSVLPMPPGTHGYDGQFFYRLALHPAATATVSDGITFDTPAYRHQRIVYPTLVWLLSYGHASLALWMMLCVNLIGLGLLGGLGAVLARDAGRSSWLGLTFALYPGFAISLGKDLAEITASVAVVGALVALGRRRFGWATVALSLAVLTRETTLLVAAGVGVASVWTRRTRSAADAGVPFLVPLVPFVVLLAWHATLHAVYGVWPVVGGGSNIGSPMVAMLGLVASTLTSLVERVNISDVALLVELGLLVVVTGIAVAHIREAPRHEQAALILTCALALCLTNKVWVDDTAFLRASTEVFVVASAVALRVTAAAARATLIVGGAAWALWAAVLL